MDNAVAVFAIAVGVGVLVMWAMSLARHQVPELVTKPWEIRTHLSAEAMMALTLIGGGVTTLLHVSEGPAILTLGLGMTLYSIVNSLGYFLQRRQVPPMVMFAVLLVLVGLASGTEIGVLVSR